MSGSLRAAVVGCGPRGLDHARALAATEGIELVAVADVSQDARRQAGESLGVSDHADLDSLLAEVQPEIVTIATPPEVREPLVDRAAAASGVQGIVVEKPLALSMSEAERMVSLCERQKVSLVVGHQLRFVPQFVALKEAIEDGAIGRVEFVRAASYGDLLNQGPHLVDAIRWLAGGKVLWAMSQRGEAALARLPHELGSEGAIPLWTTHYLALEGGARAVMETGPLHQRGPDFVDDWLDKRVTLVGSDGVAHCSAAGDCRVLRRAGGGWETHAGGMDAYLSATTSLYVELRDALGGRIRHRSEARDALASLEAVLACAQSVVDGDAAVLPLDRDRDVVAELIGREQAALSTEALTPGASNAGKDVDGIDRTGRPEVSVILPLPDHRGHAAASVRGWTEGQTLAGSRYELLILSDGNDPALDEEIRALLRDGDRLIREDGAHEIELYDLGARAARGGLLFMSEPHCVAEPECLEELLAYMRRTDVEGACCRTVEVSRNSLAHMEQRLYDEGFREWASPEHWCKVILRGFAIYRQVYLDEGGFQTRYERFAEHLLAAKLHAGGRRMGYAAGAAVAHHNTASFKELAPPVEDFARGELAFRNEYPDGRFDQYFGVPPEWAQRRLLDREAARSGLSLAVRSLASSRTWRTGKAMQMLGAAGKLAGAAVFGARWRLAATRLALWRSRIRCRLWRRSEKRLERAYRDAWDQMVSGARLEFLRQLEQVPAPVPPAVRFAPADLPDDRLFGFHSPERHNGIAFRWSGPVAFVDLPVEPGSYRVEVNTGGIGGSPEALQVFFNGRPRSVLNHDGSLTFSIDPSQFEGGDQRLALTCRALRKSSSSQESRELGLPVAEIDFHPH